MRIFYLLITGLLFIQISTSGQNSENKEYNDLQEFCSNQKGFNLLGKFDVSWTNDGFQEKQFRAVRDLGFNFVRLPVDYRTYTKTADWDTFIESQVNQIDAAVAWGKKYDVHVCLNLHRAPGYGVNSTNLPANQQLSLWTDTV
ncbi:MAG TPA: cellulase family glycosylhydrolase, partial [Prolixibacteraceae bacterium]|nr:cellulase family glycosylhydrolase [Prolixibacteraceae bacterium]